MGNEGHTELFDSHPFTWKTQKFGFMLFRLPDILFKRYAVVAPVMGKLPQEFHTQMGPNQTETNKELNLGKTYMVTAKLPLENGQKAINKTHPDRFHTLVRLFPLVFARFCIFSLVFSHFLVVCF